MAGFPEIDRIQGLPTPISRPPCRAKYFKPGGNKEHREIHHAVTERHVGRDIIESIGVARQTDATYSPIVVNATAMRDVRLQVAVAPRRNHMRLTNAITLRHIVFQRSRLFQTPYRPRQRHT